MSNLSSHIPQESNTIYEHHYFKVDPKQTLLRIDKFLINRLPNISRNQLQGAIRKNLVQVNGLAIKANYKVKPHDEIKLFHEQPKMESELKPEKIPLNIIYEDDHLLIVNKPAGMIVHPAHEHWDGTLINALLYHLQSLPPRPGNLIAPGLVHRIDMNTSGLLVVAKDAFTMSQLGKQFHDHTITRSYLALVWGHIEKKEGTIDIPLIKSPKDRRIVLASPNHPNGKRAVTHYEVINHFHYTTLVRCTLETGRTHQIRSHMKYLGHPLFGDERYEGNKVHTGPPFAKYKRFAMNCLEIIPRQALHAQTLGFIHPHTQQKLSFSSPPPKDFQEVIKRWEKYSNSLLTTNS